VGTDRLKKFNGIDSEVLFHPLDKSDHFSCSGYGDYLFYPSRITRGKRQALIVESMKYVKSRVRLVVAGQPETAADQEKIETLIRENHLEDRVQFMPRFISEDEKAHIFSGALGCIYTPVDEDSYGYVTLEACHSRKPVITCSDSGGTLILVKDGKTGLVAQPNAQMIARSMDKLYDDRKEAARLGEAGYDLMLTMGIDWGTVVRKLTA